MSAASFIVEVTVAVVVAWWTTAVPGVNAPKLVVVASDRLSSFGTSTLTSCGSTVGLVT